MSFNDILENGFLDDVQERALSVVKKDRDEFKKIFDIIDQYCIKNNLIISNKYDLLCYPDSIENIINMTYSIYSNNPFRHANKLANDLHKKNPNDPNRKYIRLRTISEKEIFAIDYNFRQIAVFYKIQGYQKQEPVSIIKPTVINDIMYMPAELELIDIYHVLYDPSRFSEKDIAKKEEERLFKYVYRRKKRGVIGNDENNEKKCSPCKEVKKQRIEAIKLKLINEWLPDQKNMILIGPWAYDLIKNKSMELNTNIEKIQLISDLNVDEFKLILEKYVNQLSHFSISYREQDLHIPKDIRTKRFTFYIQFPTNKGIVEKPFLDLFPVASFEVIPYYDFNKIKVGEKNVLLRFLFIDMWVIRVIESLGLLTKDILQIKFDYLWDLINYVRNEFNTDELVNFFGVHKDPIIDKKIANLSNKYYYPYYPELYYKKEKKYREI